MVQVNIFIKCQIFFYFFKQQPRDHSSGPRDCLLVLVSFDLVINGDQADMTGNTTINRLDFGVGAKGFADENSVAFEIAVDVAIRAKRAQ